MKNKTIIEIEEFLKRYSCQKDILKLNLNFEKIPECIVLNKNNIGNVFDDLHHHDWYEILYISKGKVIYLVDNNKYTLEAGEMVLIAPSMLHKLHEIVEEPCERIIITFTEQYAKENSTEHTDLLKIFQTIEKSKNHKVSFYNAYKRRLERLLDTMQEIMFLDNYGDDIIYNCSFSSLMVLINRECINQNNQLRSTSFDNKLLLEAGTYIDEHLEQKITVEDIARHVSLSASRLHHIFKAETGISVLKYVNKKRLAKAKELLKTGELVVNIYAKCGFQDYTSFFRAFKKEYNITPKEFQNKYYNSLSYSIKKK